MPLNRSQGVLYGMYSRLYVLAPRISKIAFCGGLTDGAKNYLLRGWSRGI